MGILGNKISKESLKAGDHIYSWRIASVYAHHGIYCGNNRVIHFTTGGGQELETGTILDRCMSKKQRQHCPQCLYRWKRDGVTESCLECFLAGGDLFLFPYSALLISFYFARGGTCSVDKSDPPEVVLHRANFLLRNNGFGAYSLFKNNCEDFAIYCKTGLVATNDGSRGRSKQISALVATFSAVATAAVTFPPTMGVLGMAVMGSGVCGAIRLVCTDEEVRREMVKVPVEKLIVNGSKLDEPKIGKKK